MTAIGLGQGKKFALIGVGGFIAPRHLEAIKDCGGELVAAYDNKDSVGIMDRFFPDCQFFTEFERFEAFVESLKGSHQQVEFVSICTPNYLHSSHIKFALRHGAHAICEKPLVLTAAEVDELVKLENKYDRRVYTVLQLRVHDAIMALKEKVQKEAKPHHNIELTYMTSRGQWYHESWKGDVKNSGGLSINIGIHFFAMLTWIFREAKDVKLLEKSASHEKGELKLEKATVQWFLSIDRGTLPESAVKSGKTTFRSIKIDGHEFEFSEGFTELHKKVYSDVLSGKGYRAGDARAAIAIAEKVRGQ